MRTYFYQSRSQTLMRKSLSTIATTIFASSMMLSNAVSAIGLPQSPREAAENTEYEFNEGDVKGLASLYDEDSIYIRKDSTAIIGVANIEKNLAKYLVGKPVMEDKGIKIFGTADTGLILGKWRIKKPKMHRARW